ncbi:DNA-binding transcriptional regulator, LysR family [Monaibacterium marinum]|uniref:DNA-binding transcriptional regulator, LysR family n=1 Tax=Pontivivens marinum TaxID=1690039 RepID=A0A2C9CPQ6_9RHOB|nr:LysR family transcriptional regulator [Monaibacterium marinum]SOH93324.1 DNA-binding transcriptional regulator, LysR family [Monaibacterium marinum]
MDMDTLRLFVLAAELLNISAAGRQLNLAPAVASARLAKLEKTVGAQLMHRTTRKVSLSLEGAEFLPYARQILAQQETALAVLGSGGAVATGTLRFAAPSSFAQRHIMPLLPEFTARYPELTLDLRLSDTRFDLIEGSFDLALRSAPLTDSSLKGRKVADDMRILCASPNYLRQNGTPATPGDLQHHRFIAFRDLAPRQMINETGETFMLQPQHMSCRLVMDDGVSQRVATVAGAGLSINSLWIVHDELRSGQLVRVLPQYRLNDRAVLWLVYPRSNVLTAKVRIFMDFLLEKIGRNPEWAVAPAVADVSPRP